MAESAKAAKPAAVPVPPPVPTPPPAPATPKKDNKFLQGLSKLMTATTWFVLGLAFLLLSVLVYKVPGIVPAVLKPVTNLYFPHLNYLFFGLGLCLLAHTRSLVVAEYAQAYRKDRKFPQAWKLPLIGVQVLILYLAGFYALLVGIGKAQPATNLMGLIIILAIFMAYLLWYVIAHFNNRMPSLASLRTAMLALVLALGSHLFWAVQAVLPSLFLGLFAVIAAIAALVGAPRKVEQTGVYGKLLCLLVAVCLLAWVAVGAFPLGQPQMDLIQLSLATGDLDLKGSLDSLTYSPDGKTIAFSQRTSEGWFLNVISADVENAYSFSDKDNSRADHAYSFVESYDFRPHYSDEAKSSLKSFKIPAGGDVFTPLFAGNGKFLFVDVVTNGVRGIWKVDSEKGTLKIIKKGPVEPFANNLLWSAQTNELLFVTRQGAGYQLSAYSALTGKTRVLLKQATPIRTPAWMSSAKQIVFCDGTHGVPYVLNIATKKVLPLLSDEERVEGGKFKEGPPIQMVQPSPDGFRFLYLTHKDKETALWSILSDGTKRVKLYTATHPITSVAWFPDSQKIVYEEIAYRCGFYRPSGNVQVMDANLYTHQSLILPQLSAYAPAVSPDGVKVAFATTQGLWYPSLFSDRKGIWVAVLR